MQGGEIELNCQQVPTSFHSNFAAPPIFIRCRSRGDGQHPDSSPWSTCIPADMEPPPAGRGGYLITFIADEAKVTDIELASCLKEHYLILRVVTPASKKSRKNLINFQQAEFAHAF